MEFLQQIVNLSEELEQRVIQKHGDTYIRATKPEVRALRLLSGHLEHVFGIFANVDFGGDGE